MNLLVLEYTPSNDQAVEGTEVRKISLFPLIVPRPSFPITSSFPVFTLSTFCIEVAH